MGRRCQVIMMMKGSVQKQNTSAMVVVLLKEKKEEKIEKAVNGEKTIEKIRSFGGHRAFKTIGDKLEGSGITTKIKAEQPKTEAAPEEKKETPKNVKEEKVERRPTIEEKENNIDTNFGRGVVNPSCLRGFLGC